MGWLVETTLYNGVVQHTDQETIKISEISKMQRKNWYLPDTIKNSVPTEMSMTKHMACRSIPLHPVYFPYAKLKKIRTDDFVEIRIE